MCSINTCKIFIALFHGCFLGIEKDDLSILFLQGTQIPNNKKIKGKAEKLNLDKRK